MARPIKVPFTPKQISAKTGALFNEIMGNTSHDVTTHILSTLLAPTPPNAIIHDNGCGTGGVTSCILGFAPPSTIKIHATDSNPYMIDGARTRIASNNWGDIVQAEVMRAQDITFPDDFFTHSFTNFVVSGLDDAKRAAEHIYRTLKPGGKAVVCTWSYMPHGEALKRAHTATRGPDTKLALEWGEEWYLPETLKDFMISGGFKPENVEMHSREVWLRVSSDLERWASNVWSFIGDREGEEKWVKEDEERWEEVVDIVVKDIEASDASYRTEEGVWMLRYTANIAVATK